MVELVTVIGTGQMATVCSAMLAERGIPVRMWGADRNSIEALKSTRENRRYLPGVRIPERVSFTHDRSRAFEGADLILSAIPCQYMRAVWETLSETCPEEVPIVSVAKGIENETLLRPTQILTDVLGDRSVASLSGPSVAAELARHLPATVVAASESPWLSSLVQEAFASQWFRVYTNDDLVGVEIAGATKNIIALAAGILDGLKAGDNAKAALLTRGLVEITRLGESLGARRETFSGLAGLGDLVTTCVSPVGRNRSAGEQIGRGKTAQEVIDATPWVIEGIPTTKSVQQLARLQKIELPITEAVHGVLFEGRDVLSTLSELMSRKLKGES